MLKIDDLFPWEHKKAKGPGQLDGENLSWITDRVTSQLS